ncbi:MAG: hypothetical protein IT258_16105 [Saprospiraceae bacterium]|nr:hypothetical protein [Saprospiraceae bacterium]
MNLIKRFFKKMLLLLDTVAARFKYKKNSSKNHVGSYFELGRGAKLIHQKKSYWHQYILGIDLSNETEFFIVSEVGKSDILFQKEISLKNLLKKEWRELLEVSETLILIYHLKNNCSNNYILKQELEKIILETDKNKAFINGNWISIDEHENLAYDFRFDMLDASPIKGKLRFLLDLNSPDKKNCKINVPANIWGFGGTGEVSVKHGQAQFSKNQLLVCENTIFPHRIKYEIRNTELILHIFGNIIKFRKE